MPLNISKGNMNDKIKIPDIIYLQWNDPIEDEGVTWCQDSINDTDVMYIRNDLHLVEINQIKSQVKKAYNLITSDQKTTKEWNEGFDILRNILKPF